MKLKRILEYAIIAVLVLAIVFGLCIMSGMAGWKEHDEKMNEVMPDSPQTVSETAEESNENEETAASPPSLLIDDEEYMKELKESLYLLSAGAARIAGLQFNTTDIEKITSVEIVSGETVTDSVLVDFSGDNGYILIDAEFRVYSFSFEGSAPSSDEEKGKLVYVIPGAFLYEKEGEYLPLDEEDADELEKLENLTVSEHYEGQIDGAEGCGKIFDTDAYMNDRFGDKWKLYAVNSLEVKGFTQYKLSCYETIRADGSRWSEGNCWLCAPFIVLQYFADNPFPMENGKYLETGFPSDEARVPYIPSLDEPKIYALTVDANGGNMSPLVKNANGEYIHTRNLISDEFDFPLIWTDMRRVTNSLWGEIDGKNVSDTRTMLEVTSGRLGFDLDTSLHLNGIFGKYLAIKSVNRGLPFIFTTADGTYGSHTMAACGYKVYVRELKLWRFSFLQFKIFYELRDGHTVSPVYYDVTSYKGLCGIVLIEKE